MKKTVVVGASTNPGRYAYLAAGQLKEKGHEIVPLGIRSGKLFGEEILNINESPGITDVDTITIYISPEHQKPYYQYLINLKPRRIIFNPGTENLEFEKRAGENGIETERACTLVLLSSNQF